MTGRPMNKDENFEVGARGGTICLEIPPEQAGCCAVSELMKVSPACRPDRRREDHLQDPTGVQAGCRTERGWEEDEEQG